MAVDRVPYLVGGGFEHSAEVMRSALYAATGGAEGITSTGDLQVLPLAVPGTSVRVLPGAATLLNRYGGGAGQSYAMRVQSATEVPITATGSTGGRSDLIIARIDDPTYQGISFDPATHQAARLDVIAGVPASTQSLAGLNLTYPAIPLARVDIPASTGTITAGMITDLRTIARPRSLRRMLTAQPTSTFALTKEKTTFVTFPSQKWSLPVPPWASRVIVRATVGSLWVNGTVASPGKAIGQLRVRIGTATSQASWYNFQALAAGARFTMDIADDVPITQHRGQTVDVSVEANSTTGSTQGPVSDSSSFLAIDLEWYE